MPNSPASAAGLDSNDDYIVGADVALTQARHNISGSMVGGAGKYWEMEHSVPFSSPSPPPNWIPWSAVPLQAPKISYSLIGVISGKVSIRIELQKIKHIKHLCWWNMISHESSFTYYACFLLTYFDFFFQQRDDLFALVEASEGRPLRLFVYNCNQDDCREVTITPNKNWGGQGRYYY